MGAEKAPDRICYIHSRHTLLSAAHFAGLCVVSDVKKTSWRPILQTDLEM